MRNVTLAMLVLISIGPVQAQSDIGDSFTIGLARVADGFTSPVETHSRTR